MGGFVGQGFWIFALLLLTAVLYCAWILHRKLEGLRQKGMATQTDLGQVLIRYRLGVQRMEEAAALIEKGEAQEAIQRLEEIRKTLPGLHLVDFFVGKAYMAQGDRSRAAHHLRSFLEKARPYDRLSQERAAEAREVLESISPPA